MTQSRKSRRDTELDRAFAMAREAEELARARRDTGRARSLMHKAQEIVAGFPETFIPIEINTNPKPDPRSE